MQLRANETDMKENPYWLKHLTRDFQYKLDPKEMLQTPQDVETLNVRMIQDAARRYVNSDLTVKTVLLPANDDH